MKLPKRLFPPLVLNLLYRGVVDAGFGVFVQDFLIRHKQEGLDSKVNYMALATYLMHYFYEGVECLCRLEKRNWWTAYMEISASFPSLLPHHSSLDSSVFWFTHPPSLYLDNTIHAGYQGLSAYSYPLRCLVARKALLN